MADKMRPQLLVVDDDASVLDILKRYLEKSAFEVLSARGGAAAIALMQTHGATIDLVVLDMTMPDIDGEMTFGELHGLQPDVHFLIYTGGCDNAALARLLATGFCSHLIKPTTLWMLERTILYLLSRHPRLLPTEAAPLPATAPAATVLLP